MSSQNFPPNVFLLHVAPASGSTAEAVESALVQLTKNFVLSTHPGIDPSMLAHRILRDTQGRYLWEIALDGCDALSDDTNATESIDQAIRNEAEMALERVARIESFAAYCDILIPPPFVHPPVVTEETQLRSFGTANEEPKWYEYAQDSGKGWAGKELPSSILEAIQETRAAVASEPNLKPYGKGHVYWALEDKAHRAWLREYFEKKMAIASSADRQRIRAFLAFQTREGTTASINTYDSQIVTWGTGWGGLGWLGAVMNRLLTNNAIRAALEDAGVRYRKSNTYDIVDLQKKRVVTGKQEALEVMRASLPLLNLLIQVARSPETRESAADAQLGVFLISAGQITNAEAIATQALFNLVSHLKHWAPGYATGCLEWALPQLPPGSPSVERDKLLVPLVGRYFYGKARGKAWIPAWKQFQLYWQHMKEDGLDCLNDPFIQASSHPTDDPFAKPIATTTPAPTPPATTPAKPTARLHSALFAGREQLEAIAQGRTTLRRGAEGPAVMALQQALLQLGFRLPAGVNGMFDLGVEQAIQEFQRGLGLGDDGVVGPLTLKKIDAAIGA